MTRDVPRRPAPGAEPDYRFSLANERTFLAWLRTSLALMAAGIGVIGVASKFSTATGRRVLGVALVLLGAVAAVTGYLRWRSTQRAMRTGSPLPSARSLGALTLVFTLAGLLAAGLVLAAAT